MTTLRILIADDHAVVRHGLRALIEKHPGWRVVAEASNGREAVAQARKFQPDVAVLDFSMPELNGLEATIQIRRAVPKTEVLVLTMHDSEKLAHRFLSAGARGFILKTDAITHLATAIETLASHQPYFTPGVSALLLHDYLNALPADSASESPDRLSPREREVLQLVAEGRTSKEIATRLGLSDKTVEAHRTHIMDKLKVHSIADLVRYAIRNEIIEP